MTDESLGGLSASNIPKLGGCIASAGNEDVLIWAKRQAGSADGQWSGTDLVLAKT